VGGGHAPSRRGRADGSPLHAGDPDLDLKSAVIDGSGFRVMAAEAQV